MEREEKQITPVLEVSYNIRKCLLALFILISLGSCKVYVQQPPAGTSIQPPSWAPAYADVNLVRYYYFPDIECYYDVWNREFVYLEDGSWMFGATLPPVYSWYDLNTAFIVLLDYNVFEPWRHFQYYVSHYPRYYYRSFYQNRYDDESRQIRGFNENSRSEYYSEPRETVQPRPVVVPGNDERGAIKKINESDREPRVSRELTERRVEPTRPPQRMEYEGKEIGQPVRVQQNMMRSQGSRSRSEESRRR